jgi:Family of unknown function (DUF6441)
MKLAAAITRSLHSDMQAELRALERATTASAKEAGRGLRTELRSQVASAGLGQRLANSWRDKHYPNQKLDAASLVYTKAPQIIRAFDEGAVIRSRRGRFLAIPTDNAPRKGTGGRRISPPTFPSTVSDRSGLCPDQADRRSWWWTDFGLRSAASPGSCGASGAQQIWPGAAARV